VNWLIILICAYSVCFGLQHKVPFIHNRTNFTDSMLACTYCTGFHSGWITYLIVKGFEYIQNGELTILYSEVFLCAFASAIFCYVVDVLVQHFEG